VEGGGTNICTPRDLNFQIDLFFNPISEDAGCGSIGHDNQCAKSFDIRIDAYKRRLMFDPTKTPK
jgi:hypothetical protein